MSDADRRAQDASLAAAINAHGIFFKRAVRTALESIPELVIVGEEYPVTYLEGGAIDLVAQIPVGSEQLLVPIECKRAYVARKRWVFFEDPANATKLFYTIRQKDLRVEEVGPKVRSEHKICVEGIEVDVNKLDTKAYRAASSDTIWKAAFQACKGAWGLFLAEHDARVHLRPHDVAPNYVMFPMIVTNAPLAISRIQDQSADLASGNLNGELVLRDVPWLVLSHPFTPTSGPGVRRFTVGADEYAEPLARGLRGKEGIVVVTATHLTSFFSELQSLWSAGKPRGS